MTARGSPAAIYLRRNRCSQVGRGSGNLPGVQPELSGRVDELACSQGVRDELAWSHAAPFSRSTGSTLLCSGGSSEPGYPESHNTSLTSLYGPREKQVVAGAYTLGRLRSSLI